jgi:hypothetical protein
MPSGPDRHGLQPTHRLDLFRLHSHLPVEIRNPTCDARNLIDTDSAEVAYDPSQGDIFIQTIKTSPEIIRLVELI